VESTKDYEIWLEQQQNAATDKPVRGVVSSYIPDLELIKAELFGTTGSADLAVRQPYIGVNAWIRVGPEAGTSLIVQRRGDNAQSEIWGYISHNTADLIKRARTNPKIAYRVVRGGELEFMSSGMAAAFFSDGGDLELWGGTISEIISQSDLEHRCNAPTFSRRLATNKWSTIGQEERFGLVKRPSKTYPDLQQDYVRRSDNTFACEYSRWMGDTANQMLATYQEGHVVDESGSFKKQGSTNKDLRFERTLLTNDGTSSLSIQIDEDLNIYVNNSNASQIEAKLQWGQLCDVTMTANKFKLQLQDTGRFSSSTSLILGANSEIQVGTPSFTVGSSTSAAASAAEPAVLGKALVTQILTPLFSALSTWFTTFAAEGASTLPGSASGATAAGTTLATTIAQVNNILSQIMRLSG
jgi:hypothetical protein